MAKKQRAIVLSKHVEERMAVRRVSRDLIDKTVYQADSSKLEDDGDTKFVKTIDKREIQVIAKPLDDENKWLIKTVWVEGENDPNLIWKWIVTLGVRLLRRRR